MRETRPPPQHNDPTKDVMNSLTDSDIVPVLATSDERDGQLSLRLAAFREGWDVGYGRGVKDGRHQEGAERDEAWNTAARGVLAIADPRGPEARGSMERRLRAAEAGCRRDAGEHWRRRMAELEALSRDRAFVRAAYSERPEKRSYEQTVALVLRARQRGAA